jgi:hypothetical protein
MLELLQAAISAPNLIYTILLVLMLLYWTLYLVGLVGSETMELFGMEAGGGGEMDLDAGGAADAGSGADADASGAEMGHGGLFGSVLHFFYVGDVPLMIILSVLILSMWTLSMVSNHLLGNVRGLVGLLLLPPILLASLAITRTVLMPFVPHLKKLLAQQGDRVELLGKRCVVRSLEVTERHGQVEVSTSGAPLLLNVVARRGVVLRQGTEAVVCDYDEAARAYVVAPFDRNDSDPEHSEREHFADDHPLSGENAS